MHPVSVVLGKEFRDARRDKRAILSAFLFPVFAPVFVYFMLTAIIELRSDVDKLTLPIIGSDHAPDFIQWLKERDVRIEPFTLSPDDAKQAVKEKQYELVLVIPENYQQRLAELRPIAIEIIQDGSRNDARTTVNRTQELIRDYNREIASLRLIARGISPQVMQVVVNQDIDVASKQERTAQALNFIPLYVILAAFVSGMGVAVDSTAGERERKTLEPLILNPVERYQIVMGKWFAATIFAAAGMGMTLILCVFAMTQVPLELIGLTIQVEFSQMLLMFIATLPLAFLSTSLQLLLGIFAKSFKDAQSYIGLLTFLPVVPSVYTMFNPIATQDWMFALPMLGQHLLLVDVLGGKEVPLLAYLYSGASCFVVGMGVVLITARLFQRESIING